MYSIWSIRYSYGPRSAHYLKYANCSTWVHPWNKIVYLFTYTTLYVCFFILFIANPCILLSLSSLFNINCNVQHAINTNIRSWWSNLPFYWCWLSVCVVQHYFYYLSLVCPSFFNYITYSNKGNCINLWRHFVKED